MGNDEVQSCIAVLGFGTTCSARNAGLAFEAGKRIAQNGYVVCVGNLGGTFYHAFQGAKSVSGQTRAIVEEGSMFSAEERELCDRLDTVDDVSAKHRRIAEECLSAIVIGGGPRTRGVINQFLELNKPVVAIMGSGGIADEYGNIQSIDNVDEAIKYLMRYMH